jgi:tRNA nucleotidyltransferase (CCA-adding enzyme)
MLKKGWEHYPHTADMGIRGFGATKEEAFAQAALAMTAIIANLKKISSDQQIEITCQENNDESLFVAWLNRILYEMSCQKMIFARFEVSIKDNQLTAKAWGEKLDIKRHKPVVEIKGATYCDLKVGQDTEGNWIAQCIVDI